MTASDCTLTNCRFKASDGGLDACSPQTYAFTLMAPRQSVPDGTNAGLSHRKE